MLLSRRTLLPVVLAAALAPRAARAASPLSERSFGHPDAKVTVTEWFSLTCSHCAAFSNETMPKVIPALIDTGMLRIVYKDFPLDQVALTAALVARALPAERYEPFIATLFASQDRWAFARGVDSVAVLRKMSALAGLPDAAFSAAIADEASRQAILAEQDRAQKQLGIDSTPTFIIGGQRYPGAMSFEAFNKLVVAATG